MEASSRRRLISNNDNPEEGATSRQKVNHEIEHRNSHHWLALLERQPASDEVACGPATPKPISFCSRPDALRAAISTGSYTMVFAPGCPLGQVRTLEFIQPVDTLDGLAREAQALWLAESRDGSARRSPRPLRRIGVVWPCFPIRRMLSHRGCWKTGEHG
jgi:hypothetical protein